MSQAGRFIFSIPCEEGWCIRVDGKETTPEPFKEALLAVPLEKGTHEIVLGYETPGLRPGGIISICSVVLAILFLIFEFRRRKVDRM